MRARALDLISRQAPGNFAMVMSTGIISIALHLLGMERGAQWLFFVNVAMFIMLVVTYVLRAAFFAEEFFADVSDHMRGPGHLTVVAGTCLLGNQCALLWGAFDWAIVFFWCAAVAWMLLLWSVFLSIFIREDKPPVEKGINGGWLLATVSTQALVILGCVIVEHTGWNREWAFLVLTALYGFGYIMYIVVITMIFYRFCYKPLPPAELDPSFWVNSGAIAITTLAGCELILRAPLSPFVHSILPFLKGMSAMAWGTATWWLVLLFFLGVWRHVRQGYPVSYNPSYWSLVFPMGTYAACTIMLSHALGMRFLMVIPEGFIYVAVLAWLCTFYGLCRFLIVSLTTAKR